ncbi:MAG: hypothetical protein ACRD29_17410 [Acidimicrobiales bacterium]
MTAPADARQAELAALRRPFRLGVAAAIAGIVFVGGIVAAFGANEDRAPGAAERWLVAVSDSTREGLRDDARDRAAELGGLEPGVSLVSPAAAEDGERSLEDLRVGRDTDPAPDTAAVPFEAHPYEADDPVAGVVRLARDDGEGWRVLAIEPRDEVEIQRPARPGWPVWVGTIGLGALIAAGCSLATRASMQRR